MERQNKILAVYCVLSLPKTIHIKTTNLYLEIFRPGPVTYCRPEPPCVVTDIPKRDNGLWLSIRTFLSQYFLFFHR